MFPKLSVIVGGTRSGKSAFAERLVGTSGLAPVYVATAAAGDAEMAERIARHRARRGQEWETIEEPLAPGAVLRGLPADRIALLDCATLWLSNLMTSGRDPSAETAALLAAVAAAPAPVVIVTNETGLGIIPANDLARSFADAQGLLNQRLAAAADLAVAVVAGLPIVLKGTLPQGMA